MSLATVRSKAPESTQGDTRVLLVEDDVSLARVLCTVLRLEHFEPRHARNLAEALAAASSFQPDVVLLDISLPDGSGFDACGPLRRRGAAALIILTARGQKQDKLRGLSLGADDYVTKPFDSDELIARIKAVLRRSRGAAGRLIFGELVIDLTAHRAMSPALSVELTARECEILRYLAERTNRVVHRDELLRAVWGYPRVPLTRSVDIAIARLRKKLEPDPHKPRFIHTVHGDGYCLTVGPG